MKTRFIVHIVGVYARIAISIQIGVQGAFIGATIVEDRETNWCIVTGIIQIRQAIAVAVSLTFSTTVCVNSFATWGCGTGVFGVVDSVTVCIGGPLFNAASLCINRDTCGSRSAKIQIVVHSIVIIIEFRLCTAFCIDWFTRRCRGAQGIQIVDDTVTITVSDIDETTANSVGAVEYTSLGGALVALESCQLVAKSIAVGV